MNLKSFAKKAVKALFLAIVSPLYVLYRLLNLMSHGDGTFQSFSQLISLIPGKIGIYIRAAFYRLACPDTSDEISIGFLTLLSHHDTTIEKGVYIGPQCNIGKCTICENTLIGSGVHILSGNKQHGFDNANVPIQEQKGTFEKISIGKDCWIGNSSVVLASISDYAIIGAGSLVNKPVPSSVIAAGNPVNILRRRNP